MSDALNQDPAPASAPDPASEAAAAAASKRMRRKRWRRRFFALAFGCLLPLFLVECTVQVMWSKLVQPSETPLLRGTQTSLGRALIEESLRGPGDYIRSWGDAHPIYRADDQRSLRLKPNLDTTKELKAVPGGLVFKVTSDARGLRGPAAPDPPPGQGLRVLCVGDSMTFGEGVDDEDTYPHQLERILAEKLQQPVRVYNAGVISLGQQEQKDVVREFVPKLQPDLVLLQFTVANDVTDNWRWKDQPGPLRRRLDACETLEHHILLINPLARWSRAYRLGIWRWGRHAIKYRYMVEEGNLARSAKLLVELRDLVREVAGRELPVGVLIAPSVVQVERGLAEALLRTERINEGIRSRLKAAGVPVLDLLPALRERADAGASLYIPVDRHWNAAGSRAVAEELAPFCRELLGG